MHLDALIQNLSAFDFKAEQERIVNDNSERISDLQAVQLSQGLNSLGKQITPPYTPYTIEQKQKYGKGLGAVTDRVTGYMTGETYRLLQTRISAGQFTITAATPKFGLLEKHYGVRLFGLNEESRKEFAETYVIPGIQKALKAKVFNSR